MVPRAVAWTVPGLLAGIPAHDTIQVGTDRGVLFEDAVVVAIDRGLGKAAADDTPTAFLDVPRRFDLARGHEIGVLRGDVDVFLRELLHGADALARGIVEGGPFVAAALNEIRQQHPGDRAVGHTGSAEAGGDEYALLV